MELMKVSHLPLVLGDCISPVEDFHSLEEVYVLLLKSIRGEQTAADVSLLSWMISLSLAQRNRAG